ncbi:RsmB/NOP family class I SAM-dependent RNA methyltransferase [Spelaeicoccus albus]|uniref:16S rRNA (Cytosine967-C5)-methyltransferase n=1 Tax=Spelaeicoccus albus TaxID=1280376 RepID=A0A7Z0D499_9MICO|nr:transcription antitermination factor NusB [Spelaeicoccus albus]NYI68595.1 16S rRNA (cytosine967-C5)-methyltransferase [Spelaeicoccus albus]
MTQRPHYHGRSETAPSRRTKRADLPRATAYSVLRAVTEDDAYANLILPGRLTGARLKGRDAAFATELAYGTLRGQGLYDAVIAQCTDRPTDKIEPAVLDVLRMGAHQLLHMRVGAHAAVDSSVALVRENVSVGASKFANAVLRRISEADTETWNQRITDGLTGNARSAVMFSHPEWIVRGLRQALIAHGRSADELEELLDADNTPARPALTALPGLSTPAELADGGAEPGRWSPLAAVVASGAPGDFSQVRAGTARVQDEGSQLVTLAMLHPDTPDERWLDLCAGPGGKAALLAASAARRGASLTAVEVSRHRAALVAGALDPVPGDSEVVTADGRRIGSEQPEAFDRVLVDVPCTGLGALRRRPEARWRRRPADIASLGPLQRELLDSAVAATRPGGVIAFTTCSPHPAETLAVLDDVVTAHPGLSVLDAPAVLDAVVGRDVGAASRKTGDGRAAQLWPHLHGTDGMFLALLQK